MKPTDTNTMQLAPSPCSIHEEQDADNPQVACPASTSETMTALEVQAGIAARKLIPRRIPGRANRKANAYVEEIWRLRDEGYSLEAIREALADAGVAVSRSTVHREATRTRASPSWPVTPSETASPSDRPAEPRSGAAADDPPLARFVASSRALLHSLTHAKAKP